jgi:hypothetical protein
MPGFMPGIHVLIARVWKDVDGRDKPGHDGYFPVSSHVFSRA